MVRIPFKGLLKPVITCKTASLDYLCCSWRRIERCLLVMRLNASLHRVALKLLMLSVTVEELTLLVVLGWWKLLSKFSMRVVLLLLISSSSFSVVSLLVMGWKAVIVSFISVSSELIHPRRSHRTREIQARLVMITSKVLVLLPLRVARLLKVRTEFSDLLISITLIVLLREPVLIAATATSAVSMMIAMEAWFACWVSGLITFLLGRVP